MGNSALPLALEMAKNINMDVKLEGKYAAIAIVATAVTVCAAWVACTAINAHNESVAMMQDYTMV